MALFLFLLLFTPHDQRLVKNVQHPCEPLAHEERAEANETERHMALSAGALERGLRRLRAPRCSGSPGAAGRTRRGRTAPPPPPRGEGGTRFMACVCNTALSTVSPVGRACAANAARAIT